MDKEQLNRKLKETNGHGGDTNRDDAEALAKLVAPRKNASGAVADALIEANSMLDELEGPCSIC